MVEGIDEGSKENPFDASLFVKAQLEGLNMSRVNKLEPHGVSKSSRLTAIKKSKYPTT